MNKSNPENRELLINGSTFFINELTTDDLGNYECQTINKKYTTRIVYSIESDQIDSILIQIESFSIKSSNYDAKIDFYSPIEDIKPGQNVEIKCSSLNDNTEMQWYLYGKALGSDILILENFSELNLDFFKCGIKETNKKLIESPFSIGLRFSRKNNKNFKGLVEIISVDKVKSVKNFNSPLKKESNHKKKQISFKFGSNFSPVLDQNEKAEIFCSTTGKLKLLS